LKILKNKLIIFLIILISVCQYLLSAYRWMYISKYTDLNISYNHALKFYYISSFLNNILPGGIIGDFYRIYSISETKKSIFDFSKPFQSVFFERLSGQIVMFIFFTISLTFYFLINHKYVAFFYLFGFLLLIILLFRLFFYRKVKIFIESKIIGKNFLSIFTGKIFWNHFFYSFLVVSSYILVYIISALSLKINIDYFSFLVFTPIILFSMSLPISIGGWGVRETAALLISFLLGLSTTASVTVSLVYGILNLFCSLPGLYLLFFKSKRA